MVFPCLGIALALHGWRAIRARILNLASVGTSVFMNTIAAAPGWRNLAGRCLAGGRLRRLLRGGPDVRPRAPHHRGQARPRHPVSARFTSPERSFEAADGEVVSSTCPLIWPQAAAAVVVPSLWISLRQE